MGKNFNTQQGEGIIIEGKNMSEIKEIQKERMEKNVPELYRCLICAHEVSAPAKPNRCPFCGANIEYLLNATEYYQYELGSLSDDELEDLETTLELEISNAVFYQEAEDMTEDLEIESYYRYFRRHEGYHRDEIMDILGVDDWETVDVELLELPGDHEDIFEKSIEIEQQAISFYITARNRTDNETLVSIYSALIGAEGYHTEFFDYLLNRGQ